MMPSCNDFTVMTASTAPTAPTECPRAPLGCVDRGVLQTGLVNGPALGDVTDAGRGGVRVDVVDVLGVEAGGFQSPVHGLGGPDAVRMRCHYVEAVRGDARAEKPSVDPCPACLGMLLGLDDHERAAFAEHEAGAVLVEWPRCPRGVVVIGGHHDAHIGERGDGCGLDGCLDTTADGDIGIAVSDLPPGVGYALVTGGTRRDGVMTPPRALRSRPMTAAGPLGMNI